MSKISEEQLTRIANSKSKIKYPIPDGYFGKRELDILYNIAKLTTGPILEIGSFVGRSTSAIAYGIRDSEVKKEFYSIDLHMTVEEFVKHFNPLSGVKEPHSLYKKYMEDGGTFIHLKKHLKELSLDKYVTTLKGNFAEEAPKLKYGMIFTDATHNKNEIDVTVPEMIPFVKPGTILVCHDIVNEEMVGWIKEYIPLNYTKIAISTLVSIVG